MASLCNKKSLKQDLDKFRSTFEFDTTNLATDRVRSLIKKLEDDQINTKKSEDEDIKIINFLSYLYFLLNDHKHALQLVDDSLQKDPDNIIANANKARILLENGEISDVEKIISKLQDLEKRNDYDKRKCYAEADLAYAYARSGPWYHQRAVDLYSRLVLAYPTEYPWQFGLGLTLRRQTHHFHSQADLENEKTTVDAAERLLAATKSDDPILRAKAYAELGRAVYTIWKRKYSDLPPKIKKLRDKDCFEKALEICPEEPSVLQICGQYARYRKELDKSETLLRKSLRINPTPHGYHHLALTLKFRVLMNRETSQEQNPADKSGHQRGFIHKPRSGEESWSHSPDVQRHNLRQMIKSPLKVQVHPGNGLLKEAIEMIDEAEKINSYALNMQYDQGILYRMLGETANAVGVFKQIVSKRKCLPTKTLMTNVYEQLGLCLLELSDSKEIPPEKKMKYKQDGQSHLSHALQLQLEIVANDPHFKEAWNSYSTLKELLSNESGGKPKQLAVLHMLMGDHMDSIAIYKELLSKDKENMDPNDYKNMLECYMKGKQFEECVTLLTSLECTTMFAGLPPSLIFDVYINGACQAYSTDNVQLAYRQFRRAFQVYGMFDKAIVDQNEADEDEGTKDILILHSCSQGLKCGFPSYLGKILEDCTGLRYTINTDNVLWNANTTESMKTIMQKISCIIIMTHDSADKYDEVYVSQAIQLSSEKGGPSVLTVSDNKHNIPYIARTIPFIRTLPLLEGGTISTPPTLEDTVQPLDQIPDQLSELKIEWVKDFIYLLRDQHHK